MGRRWLQISQTVHPQMVLDVIVAEMDDFRPENIENQWSPTMQRIERLHRQLEQQFLNPEKLTTEILAIADAYLVAAAKLRILAELKLEQVREEKVRHAPHPNNPKLSD